MHNQSLLAFQTHMDQPYKIKKNSCTNVSTYLQLKKNMCKYALNNFQLLFLKAAQNSLQQKPTLHKLLHSIEHIKAV